MSIEELNALPDSRFARLTREQVACMYRKAAQATAMHAFVQACAERVYLTGDYLGATWAAILDVEQGGGARDSDSEAGWPQLPVAVYVAPARRWAGGPPESDAWYFDHNSF